MKENAHRNYGFLPRVTAAGACLLLAGTVVSSTHTNAFGLAKELDDSATLEA